MNILTIKQEYNADFKLLKNEQNIYNYNNLIHYLKICLGNQTDHYFKRLCLAFKIYDDRFLNDLRSEFLGKCNKNSCCKELSIIFMDEHGLTERTINEQLTGKYYILKDDSNILRKTNIKELKDLSTQYIGRGAITTSEINRILSSVDNFQELSHNIIAFNNCTYDISNFEKIKPEIPTIPAVEIKFNYKENLIIKDYNDIKDLPFMFKYLATSLNKDFKPLIQEVKKGKPQFNTYNLLDFDEITLRKVNGVLQIIGYLLTSGHIEQKIFAFIGRAGTGRSVFGKFLQHIFFNCHSTIQIHDLDSNPFAKEDLIDSHVNFDMDMDTKPLKKENTTKMTGDGFETDRKNKSRMAVDGKDSMGFS